MVLRRAGQGLRLLRPLYGNVLQQARYNSGKSMFQQLDEMFGSAGAATPVDAATSTSFGSSALYSVYEATGLQGGLVLFLAGAVTRLATLYFSLYGDRAAARMQNAMVELKPAYDGFHRIYNSDRYKATEIQVEATKVQEFKKAVYAKHQTSNIKSFAALVGSPLIIYGFRSASQASNPLHLTGLGTQSFLWLSLGMPDPTYILPVVSCGLTLLNFELSLGVRENTTIGWARNMVLCARGAAVCSLPVLSMVNSGVLLYWVGMSCVGLLQPLLLRSEAFKQFFSFPPKSNLAATQFEDPMRERFSMEHPFVHRLLNVESDENVDMITRATLKQQGQAEFPTTGSAAGFRSGLTKSHVPSLGHKRVFAKRSLEDETPITSFDQMAGTFADATNESVAAPESKKSGASFASAGWKKTNTSSTPHA